MSLRQMKLGLFLSGYGHHLAAWRHPGSQSLFEFSNCLRWVRQAEDAGFDLVFLSDTPAIKSHGGPVDWRGGGGIRFEPLTLLAALASHTSHIGLVATATTSYEAPYHLARKFASLDHLSSGRAGWNIVTTSSAAVASNFGEDAQLDHDLRYQKSRECVEVVKRLWDSWEDDAFLVDREAGRFYDPGKLHVSNHQGTFFKVSGPLNIKRPPQGYPVLVQAGSSEAGLDLAAETSEVIFTAQHRFEDALAFSQRLRQRLDSGRRVRIMPGVTVHVGRSRTEAEDKFQRLQELIHPEVGLKLLSAMAGGFDFSGHSLDGPLPELPPTNGNRSRQQLLESVAQRESLSLRALYQRMAAARGHLTLVGSASEIVDQLQHWFEAGAADGFNIMPPWLPGGLDDIIALVLPELRRRGLFRQHYQGATLREHLELERPGNRFTPARGQHLSQGPFSHHGFTLFWLARIVGMTSNQIQMVAVGWQLYQLTGNVLDLGWVGLAQFLPTLLLALPAGHWVDRFDRRRVLLLALPIKALAVTLLGVCALQDEPSRLLILLLVALIGAERAVEMPANASLLTTLVPAGMLSRAFALSNGGMQAAIVIGPALGGFIYLAGPAVAYFTSAALYLASAVLIATIGGQHRSGMRKPFSITSLFAGVGYIRRHPVVMGAISLDLFAVLLGGTTALLPVYAADVLHVDAWGLGLLRSGQAVGALLAALVMACYPIQHRVGQCIFIAVAVFGLATMIFAVSTSLFLSILALAIIGAADVVGVVLRQTLVQLETPDAMRGRVSAVNTLCVGASNQLGEFESGVTAAWLGVVPAVLLGGGSALLVAVIWLRLFPELYHRDSVGKP